MKKSVFIQFDNDQPLKAWDLPEGETMATFPVGKPKNPQPIDQGGDGSVTFSDGKKKLKIFIK